MEKGFDTLTIKEWDQVEQFTVLRVSFELRQYYAVLLLVLNILIVEVYVDHFAQGTIEV